ncbi:MAG TPA: alpha/beta hydrolase [Chitinophagaceae bacterium]|nr:alpha/beta hydrolase [Chitinophagaceae bacterium]
MNKEVSYNGHRICYHVHGKGQPVILIHGFGETSDVWDQQIEFLQKDFLLIIPDLPGSGESELVEDMSIEGMADVIKAILDAQKKDSPLGDGGKEGAKTSVIGHSMGGHITLAFAEKFGHHLKRFGLFHSSAAPDTEERKKMRRKGITFMRKHGPFKFLETMVPNLYNQLFRDQHPEFVGQRLQSMRNISLDTLVYYYEAMINRPDRRTVLKNTGLPVLFIIGEKDTAVAMEDLLNQSYMPGKSYIYILSNSGHMGMLEEPNRSNSILEDFLKSE